MNENITLSYECHVCEQTKCSRHDYEGDGIYICDDCKKKISLRTEIARLDKLNDSVTANREIDALVKSFVMGGLPPVSYSILFDYIPHYTTNISDAMTVWDKLVEMERFPDMHEGPNENGDIRVFISLVNPVIDLMAHDKCHAIVRAALAAVGG